MSPKSANLAKKIGFTNLTVYIDGEPGWKKSDYYTVPTVEYVKSANLVIIDLRDAKAVSAGHIPRAVNIPAAQLESVDKMFPAFKGAPIVLYADQDDSLPAAGSTIRDWGYTNVMILPGGVKAWQAKGFELATGAAATTISYVRKHSPAEISIAEFEQGMKGGTLLVIDVRTPEEYAKGHFKNAINIPTEQMAKRYLELPKDMPLALHCSTGARAEMAYDILSAKGVLSRFLKAKVDFAADGTPQITEE
jgi:rhodanese-related sulfurtransferase